MYQQNSNLQKERSATWGMDQDSWPATIKQCGFTQFVSR